jgi:MoaA/NifB/PqqE/SkfB family radical SAM enzyme
MSAKSYLQLFKGALKARLFARPYKLNLAVTYRCNSRCLTCQIWREYKANPDIQKGELSLEEFSKIFESISNEIRWISLTGGEPFLREDLIQIVTTACKKFHNLALISIPTNGLLHERVLRFIEHLKNSMIDGPDISISFSIDGPREIHDRIRGIKGAFDAVWKTYLESRRIANNHNRLHLHIETTISSFNILEIKPFIEKIKKEGHSLIVTIAHDAYLYKNTGNKGITINLKDKNTEEFFYYLQKRYCWYKPSQLINRAYIKRIPIYLKNSEKQVLPCAALKSSFAINPYGDVLPCLMWDRVLGNLREHDLDTNSILRSSEAKETRRWIAQSRCPNCWTPCEAVQTLIQHAPLSLIA